MVKNSLEAVTLVNLGPANRKLAELVNCGAAAYGYSIIPAITLSSWVLGCQLLGRTSFSIQYNGGDP